MMHILAIARASTSDTFVFTYDAADRKTILKLIDQFAKFVKDPELDFDMCDAFHLTRRLKEKHPQVEI